MLRRGPYFATLVLLSAALASCGRSPALSSEEGPGSTDRAVPGVPPRAGRWDPSAGYSSPINTAFAGVTCFRGNPQRNYTGEGPLPTGNVRVRWRAAIGVLPNGHWSGVGWTGQPLLVEWPEAVRKHMNFLDGKEPKIEIIQGALDGQVHFFDAETGEQTRKPLSVPSPRYPIKGTVSVDPRGYPLLYVGCGINVGKPGYRVYSLLDFKELLYLPAYDGKALRRWAGSDSNALVLEDTLFLPAENGLFYKVKLNAQWDPDQGKITIDPKVEKVPIDQYGTENSMAVWDNNGFFADSNGGYWKINLAKPTEFKKIAELGDDTDSSSVIDREGNIFIGIEVDKRAGKGGKGGIYKLDRDGKTLWRWDFQAGSLMGGGGQNPINGGILSTAALGADEGLVYYTTSHHPRIGQGYLLALDQKTGRLRWKVKLTGFAWSSPIYASGAVFAADSSGSVFIRNATTGESLLTDESGGSIEHMSVGANVESSPIVWKGRVYVGLRGGACICLESAPTTP